MGLFTVIGDAIDNWFNSKKPASAAPAQQAPDPNIQMRLILRRMEKSIAKMEGKTKEYYEKVKTFLKQGNPATANVYAKEMAKFQHELNSMHQQYAKIDLLHTKLECNSLTAESISVLGDFAASINATTSTAEITQKLTQIETVGEIGELLQEQIPESSVDEVSVAEIMKQAGSEVAGEMVASGRPVPTEVGDTAADANSIVAQAEQGLKQAEDLENKPK